MTTGNNEATVVDTVLRVYPELRRFAAVVAPPELAPDDLVHDALVAALRLRDITQLDDPGSYLRRSIVNLAANERRRLGRHRQAVQRLSAGRTDGAALDVYPSDLAHLSALSPIARAVLYLRHVEGHSFETIGELTSMRASTARKIAQRARHRLKTEEVKSP